MKKNKFEWKVEDMVLLNQKHGLFLRGGEEKIYDCESVVSREDKIAFVDSKQDGILSYLLALIEKFNKDVENMPKDSRNKIKTVSLKAWIKKNDTKYSRPIIDNYCSYGKYRVLGTERNITVNKKGRYDTYEDIVDEVFHRQLKMCEKEERRYFLEHDEYSILKSKVRNYLDEYRTSLGVCLSYSSGGEMHIYKENDISTNRDITIEELKDLISRYEQIDALVKKLTEETQIFY